MAATEVTPVTRPNDLYERAPCGLIATDSRGTLLNVNAAFAQWSGYSAHELIFNKRFVDLLTPGGRIYHETHFARLLELQGYAREIAFELIRADGTRLPILVNSVRDTDPETGDPIVRSAVFDATDRRSYERELLAEKRRAEESEARSRELVRTLRQILVPMTPPVVPGLDVGVGFRPAGDGSEIGGDFYDIFQIPGGDWIVVVADVQGKGEEAAVLTAVIRYAVRAAAVSNANPAAIAATVNEVLVRHDTERSCTAVLGRLSPSTDGFDLAICSAGHPLPVHRPSEGKPSAVGAHGLLLGVLGDVSYSEVVTHLAAGDSIIFCTDGIGEGRHDGELFEEVRLAESISTLPFDAVPAATELLEQVVDFQDGEPRDDMTVLVLSVPRSETA